MAATTLNPGWSAVNDTLTPTAAGPDRDLMRRFGALLIPAGHDPVMASPATLIWLYLLLFPGLILLNPSRGGLFWWLELLGTAVILAVLALRFRSAGDGRARPLLFGMINAGLLLLHMGLTLNLSGSVRSLMIIYAALPAIVVMMTPRVHTPRDVVIIITLLDLGLLGLAGWSRTVLPPEQALLWSDVLVLVVPFAIVAYTNTWLRRINRERAAVIRQMSATAERDALTGLVNRHGLLAAASRLLPRARACGAPAGLLLVDMDGLKDINDSFGHGVGDQALRHFGETLRRCAGPEDVVARLGGDEYALLLVGEPGASFPELARRYTDALAGTAYRDIGTSRSMMLSASWGAAESGPDGETLESLLAAADERLLWHKARPRPAPPNIAPLMELFVPRGRRALADALGSLMEAARDVATANDSSEFLRRAALRAAQITGATTATVTLMQDNAATGYRVTRGQSGWETLPAAFPGWDSIAGHVLRTGEPYFSNDLRNDPFANQEAVTRLGLHNCVCVPMRAMDGAVIGIVFLSNKQGRAPFSELDVSIAQAFSDLATAALDKPVIATMRGPANTDTMLEQAIHAGI